MKVIERMKEKGGVLIGMVHCLPLPGTMNYGGSMDAIVDKATEDAHALETVGFDAVLVEATMDKPMGMVRGPLQLAAMSVICGAVHRAVHIPMGVSYLTPDCRDVFSIAKASGADFVRITAFVDTLHFPVGTVQPCAVQAWEGRREGNMQDISILADIQVKHAELVYPQTTLEQSAYLAQAQGADAIVVTGNATGEETPMETIRRVAKVSKIQIVVGSGVAPSNVRTQMELARGFIVGTSVKQDGNLMAPIDLALASELARARDRG